MKPPRHPSEATIARLIACKLGPEAAKPIIAHLLGRCERCLAFARGVLAGAAATPETREERAHGHVRPARPAAPSRASLPPGPPLRGHPEDHAEHASVPGGTTPEDPLSAYDQAYALSRRRTVEVAGDRLQARRRAAALWAELAPRPQRQRLLLIDRDQRFQQWHLFEHLLQVALDFHWREPASMLEVCVLALAVVDRLHPTEFADGLVFDLRAQALGHLANAQRLAGDLHAAEQTLAEAWIWLARGTGDPLERANLLGLEGSFRLFLGDFSGATFFLGSAAALYRQFSDRHSEGRCRLFMAAAAGHHQPHRGAALARHALALIDGGRAPRLELLARHTLSWFLNDSGQVGEARRLLEETRPLYRQVDGSQPQLHQRWLEGRISRGLGNLTAAERIFKEVWRDFRDAGFNQDVTLVCLDLAEVYVAQRKTRQAILLLRVFHTTLRLWKMHSHGLAAWLLLREAVAAEASRTSHLLREAALYFRQSWGRPRPFRHPAHAGESPGAPAAPRHRRS